MNLMQMMQAFNQLRQMQNPQTAMQHMFGNDPKFQQAMKMAQGKTTVGIYIL